MMPATGSIASAVNWMADSIAAGHLAVEMPESPEKQRDLKKQFSPCRGPKVIAGWIQPELADRMGYLFH